MALVRFRCARCAALLTKPVRQLAALPERLYGEDGRFMATVDEGSWAFDPTPLHLVEPVAGGPWPVLNAGDVLQLQAHPEARRSSGCCGRDGLDGPNVVCPTCGAEVATLRDDCWCFNELRLEPEAVLPLEVITR